MKLSPLATFLIGLGSGVIIYLLMKPRKAAGTTTGGGTEPTPSTPKLSQAEADAVAKQYEDFKNSGNAEIMVFPSPSQQLGIKLNEAGYRLDVIKKEKLPSDLSIYLTHKIIDYTYTAKAVYVGGVVHQLEGYKYSDGVIVTPKKPLTQTQTTNKI